MKIAASTCAYNDRHHGVRAGTRLREEAFIGIDYSA
jgi:hypothetical protein